MYYHYYHRHRHHYHYHRHRTIVGVQHRTNNNNINNKLYCSYTKIGIIEYSARRTVIDKQHGRMTNEIGVDEKKKKKKKILR